MSRFHRGINDYVYYAVSGKGDQCEIRYGRFFVPQENTEKEKPEREKIFAGGNVHHDAGIGRLQRWDAGNVGDVRGLDGTDR